MDSSTTISELQIAFDHVIAAGAEIDDEHFFRKKSPAIWSAAEEVQHLSLTYMPFNRMLPQPEILLKRWGASNRESRDVDTFQADYKAATLGQPWKTFPPFVPMHQDEPVDYIDLHVSQQKEKIEEFYERSGGDMTRLRTSVIITEESTGSTILEEYATQSGRLIEAAQGPSQEQFDACQFPLPYVGFVTALEGLYFTLSHTRHHLRSISAA